MITDLERDRYRQDYQTLELKDGQALFKEFHDGFSPTDDKKVGGGAAGSTFRFKDKIVKLQHEEELDSFESEVYASIAMKRANIPGVVHVEGYVTDFNGDSAIIFGNGGSDKFSQHKERELNGDLSSGDVMDILMQVLNTLMHVHVSTDITHGDVAEHNIVYTKGATPDGTPRILATLVDFGNAAFKDDNGTFPISERITKGTVDPLVYMMNTARRSEAFSGDQFASFGKDGWKTDAYAVGVMIAEFKGWEIHHLTGFQKRPRGLSRTDKDLFRLVSHLLAEKTAARWSVADVSRCDYYLDWCRRTKSGVRKVTRELPREVGANAAAAAFGVAAAPGPDPPATEGVAGPEAPGALSRTVLRVGFRGGGENSGGSRLNDREERATAQDMGTAAPTGGEAVRRNLSRAAPKEQSAAAAPATSAVQSKRGGRRADGEGGEEGRRTKRRRGSPEERAAAAAAATITSAEDFRAENSGGRLSPQHVTRVTRSVMRMRQAQELGGEGGVAAAAATPTSPEDLRAGNSGGRQMPMRVTRVTRSVTRMRQAQRPSEGGGAAEGGRGAAAAAAGAAVASPVMPESLGAVPPAQETGTRSRLRVETRARKRLKIG